MNVNVNLCKKKLKLICLKDINEVKKAVASSNGPKIDKNPPN